MKTGTSQGGTGTPMRVVLLIARPVATLTGPASRSGTGGAATSAATSLQSRVAEAMRKAAQSSPTAQAAFRRNPAAEARIAGHAQKLAHGSNRSPLAALKQGLGVSAGLRTIARDMRKEFRDDAGKGGGKPDGKPGGKGGDGVKIKHSHPLADRGQRHAAAAERGLRRGGLGLLSAAWHGTQIMREQRKTLNRERADARADAQVSGKPLPPEGMRALLGSAVKGVGIARGLRAGLSDMPAQERAGTGGGARGTQARSPGDRPARNRPDAHGRTQAQGQRPAQGQGAAPRVLHATGFALGGMAFASGQGGARGTPQAALGLLLIRPRRTRDEDAQA